MYLPPDEGLAMTDAMVMGIVAGFLGTLVFMYFTLRDTP
jgi:hypothetical protein